MGLAGREGCTNQYNPRRKTHVTALEDPRALAVVTHFIPIPQSDEGTPSDIARVPEIQTEENNNDRDLY